MPIKVMQKQRRTFTLSPNVLVWIDTTAKEDKVSRSELLDRLLARHSLLEKEKQMEEGYKALREIMEATAEGTFSAQREVVPDY